MRFAGAVFLAAIGIGSSQASGNADLLWPSDPRTLVREIVDARRPGIAPVPSWPRTWFEICGDDSPPAGYSEGGAFPASLMEDACKEGVQPGPIGMRVALGAFGLGRTAPLGAPFEDFDGAWGSTRTDPELARTWTEMPAVVDLGFRHGFSPRASVVFRMGLRRDLSAWRRDALALNPPFSAEEVDLNEPSLGYFHWEGDYLAATVGRFPIHWSPDREFGLMLSDAAPYHNAVQAVLKMPRVNYRFLVSSLNPWLAGTPAGSVSGTDYPVGSEQWRQRNYPVLPGSENAHKRVYDQPVKTLVAHRIETWAGPAAFGITESNIIGGKAPDLRDANPFALFHNDFHHGYSNNNVSADAALKLPMGLLITAEVFLDDVRWGDTEGSSPAPSLLGYLAGLRHSFAFRGWALSQGLHAVRTDPFLYGYLQPLNTYSSRHVLTSNDQRPEDARFVDKYVVDYPIGYLRGGDALDFRYAMEGLGSRGLSLKVTLDILSRGEAGSQAPFEEYYQPHGSSPSGTEHREFRAQAAGSMRLRHGISVSAGIGWREEWNRPPDRGGEPDGVRAEAGLTWINPGRLDPPRR